MKSLKGQILQRHMSNIYRFSAKYLFLTRLFWLLFNIIHVFLFIVLIYLFKVNFGLFKIKNHYFT